MDSCAVCDVEGGFVCSEMRAASRLFLDQHKDRVSLCVCGCGSRRYHSVNKQPFISVEHRTHGHNATACEDFEQC